MADVCPLVELGIETGALPVGSPVRTYLASLAAEILELRREVARLRGPAPPPAPAPPPPAPEDPTAARAALLSVLQQIALQGGSGPRILGALVAGSRDAALSLMRQDRSLTNPEVAAILDDARVTSRMVRLWRTRYLPER